MKLAFTKMEGLGNDYVYVNALERPLDRPEAVARIVSDRHFGVGGDGLVLMLPSECADFRMRMFNRDGSEAQMCGNAIRCVGKYLRDRGYARKDRITVETLGGVKTLELFREGGEVRTVSVNMGIPVLKPDAIPAAFEGDRVVKAPLEAEGRAFTVTCVSMGNPHAVFFADEITDELVLTQGPDPRNPRPLSRGGQRRVRPRPRPGHDRHARLGAGLGRNAGLRHRSLRRGGGRRPRGSNRPGGHGAAPRRGPQGGLGREGARLQDRARPVRLRRGDGRDDALTDREAGPDGRSTTGTDLMTEAWSSRPW